MHTPPVSRTVAASGLTKDYGGGAGVFDLDLEIERGSIVGFIGPSGSGKTTTIRMMTGVIAPDRGELMVLGERPMSFTRDTRARIGYMPQHAILYPDLTLLENLNFAASLYGVPYKRKERIAELVEFVQLEGRMDRLPREASGGEKRRIMLASTFFHRPELVFLDEPTAGIDPVLRRRFWDRFRELASDGRSLLVTTQYVGEAAYCDYVAVLANGEIVVVDTPEGLRHAAYGGEQIEVTFNSPPSSRHVSELGRLVGLEDVEPEWVDSRTARIVVDKPGEAIQAVTRWAEENQVELEKSEAFQPEYDDVFVQLIAKYEGREDADVD
ncbi:MAG TPA: ABC transporter ATP-binding protein [Acidimicrobiia bacterium]